MKFWKEKWREMSWYRRGLLLTMAAMVFISLGVLIFNQTRPGLPYRDGFLLARTEGTARYYEGTVDGTSATFTAAPDGTVTYRWGEHRYGPWRVEEDPAAVPVGKHWLTGIRITQSGQEVFRGGYDPDGMIALVGEDGEADLSLGFGITSTSGGTLYVDGREVTRREMEEPGLSVVARVAMGPALTCRGYVGFYLLGLLVALLNSAQICFPGLFFRWSIRWHVRSPEDAEPSDFYIAMEKLEWLFQAGVCLLLFWQAATIIP